MIDIALNMGLHLRTARDMSKHCRALLDAQPTCRFPDLEAGKTYAYPSGPSFEVVTVNKLTPTRTRVTASVNNGTPRRVYKSSYTGTFIELDDTLIALAPLSHQEIVQAAVDRGLDVPPEVKREYPALFLDIPERFAQPNYSAPERVKNALNPSWLMRGRPLTTADLDAQIEAAHQQIRMLQDTRIQALVANPDTAMDYDRYLEGHRADIDFYRWLRRQIDVGGVFYIA